MSLPDYGARKRRLSWMIFAIMRSPYTNKRGDAMHDTTIATKLLVQLKAFVIRVLFR